MNTWLNILSLNSPENIPASDYKLKHCSMISFFTLALALDIDHGKSQRVW